MTATGTSGMRAATRRPSIEERAMLGVPSFLPSPGRRTRPLVRPRHWMRAGQENPLARFIPFSSLVSPHDVITRVGDYLRVWRLQGVAFECADEPLIAERHEALCSLLR